jgi:hypothetical protein
VSLEWELVGKQQLWEQGTPGKGYAYAPLLWRTPVPGGWLLMTVNSKSSDPQPMVSFYPDPDHVWRIATDPQAQQLLRPANSPGFVDPALLLRASTFNPETE